MNIPPNQCWVSLRQQSLRCLHADLHAGSETIVWLAGGSQSSEKEGPLNGLEGEGDGSR